MLQDIRGGTFWVSAPAIYSASSNPSPSSHATEIASGDALSRLRSEIATNRKKGSSPERPLPTIKN